MSRRALLLELVLGLSLAALAGHLKRTSRELTPLPSLLPAKGCAPFVSVIVPARNEECNAGRCVQSLLDQCYPAFEVVAIDDESTDRTGKILACLASRHAQLRVISGEPLPPGWIGKSWALAQGADRARGEWLLFTDADTVHEPNALAAAVAFAQERELDLLSLLPQQELGSLAERLLLPGIFAIILPASGLTGTGKPDQPARALGQYLLVRRDCYDAVGGHAAVKDHLIEDFGLAQVIAAHGARVGFADGRASVRTRMYRSAGEIWQGFTKNLFPAALEQPARIPLAVVGIPAIYLLPFILLSRYLARIWRGDRRAATIALAAGAGVQSAVLLELGRRVCRFTAIPDRYALAYPIGSASIVAILLNSARRYLSGEGLIWKGRVYRARIGAETERHEPSLDVTAKR